MHNSGPSVSLDQELAFQPWMFISLLWIGCLSQANDSDDSYHLVIYRSCFLPESSAYLLLTKQVRAVRVYKLRSLSLYFYIRVPFYMYVCMYYRWILSLSMINFQRAGSTDRWTVIFVCECMMFTRCLFVLIV